MHTWYGDVRAGGTSDRVRHDLADAARDYNWTRVLRIVARRRDCVNASRPGGRARFTPLHQAAHGAAPQAVVDRLLAMGAWRTIRNARGLRFTGFRVGCQKFDLYKFGKCGITFGVTPAERNSAQQQQIADLRADLERLRGELTRRERDDKARRRQNDRLQRQNDGLQRQNDRLQHRIDHLEQQLAAARRAGHRQAAPFAKDRPQGRGGRPGRRAGAQYGRHGCRPRPARVDETHAAPVPAACPACGGAVEVTRVASQYQEELPVVRPVVRRFDIEVGHCSQCQRRVQGHHVLQTSDALGAAGVQLGPGVVALVVELHTEMGVPLAKVAHLLRTTFGLQVTPGGLAHVLHRAARAAAPAYAELCEQVRNAPVVTPDETGWRVVGVRHWLWTFVTPDTTVYAICPGRGFNDAATVLGTDYVGVLVRDGWAPYRCYDGLHQTCLNHLLQRCKQLREDYPDSPWAGEVQAVLRAGLDLRDRCNAGALSEHGMATARGRLTARLARLVDAPPPLGRRRALRGAPGHRIPGRVPLLVGPLARRHQLARRTGHPARRRHPQGVRRNRTRHGADTQQVLASVVRTARQRNLDLPPLIAAMLRAAEPVVPELLGLPPPPP